MELPKYIPSLNAEAGKHQSSRLQFYLSLAYILLGLVWALFAAEHFFMVYFLLFGIAGLTMHYIRLNYPSAGITFNAGFIKIQGAVFNKQIIPVEEIEFVNVHISSILLGLTKGRTEVIELSGFSFLAVKELKECFSDYAVQNGIDCIIK